MNIHLSDSHNQNDTVHIINKGTNPSAISGLDKAQSDAITSTMELEKDHVILREAGTVIAVVIADTTATTDLKNEKIRKTADKIATITSEYKSKSVSVIDHTDEKENGLAFCEGYGLSKYQFLKYFSDKDKKSNRFESVHLSGTATQSDIDELSAKVQGVYKARDLVNEPNMYMTAPQMAKEFEAMCEEAGISIEVFDKKRIIKEEMGGLLAVNLGSIEEPRFSIMEYKPEGATNAKPYVMVGKGVVYDTGGMSLKPTADSMDFMKSDMGGAAAVSGAIYAIAKAKLNIHVIAIVPSTDNRPDGNAYVPGDVITMHNKMTVEVLNTDAEGRMILADALSWAKNYDPELVVDCATLTGAAAAAIGKQGVVAMGNADRHYMESLKESGHSVHERIAEFPFWDDYAELLKSDIADMKNIGGRLAGAITAGKFLEKFTDYPYIHIDIAGSAFNKTKDSYNGIGGSGVGVRLLFDFFKRKAN
jgi:leucyl aminopeptidase